MDVEIEELGGEPDLGYRYRMTCGGKTYDVVLEYHPPTISILINGQLYTPPDVHLLSWPTARHAALERVRELCIAEAAEEQPGEGCR